MRNKDDFGDSEDASQSNNNGANGIGNMNEKGEYPDVLPESMKKRDGGVYVSILQNIGAGSDKEESHLEQQSQNDKESFMGSAPNPFGLVDGKKYLKKKSSIDQSYPLTNPSQGDNKRTVFRERLISNTYEHE